MTEPSTCTDPLDHDERARALVRSRSSRRSTDAEALPAGR